MDLTELDEIAVEDKGDGYWDVYVPQYPGADAGEYYATVAAADLVQAQQHDVQVYDRRTGRMYEQVQQG